MRYKLHLSYNGSGYHGWQVQENAVSVQETLQKQLSLICRENIEVIGCGRTDTGVHARNYVAHFDLDAELPENFVFRINGMLPADIAIDSCEKTSDDFHARFDATHREYKYYLHFQKDPFLEGVSWFRHRNLDFILMNEAAMLLVGKKEFTCFCKGEAPNSNYTCHVFDANWEWNESSAVFRITADRFLRNMVRAIVGTLMEVGTGKIGVEDFKTILQNGTRSDAGSSVPAHGLFLENIEYPK